MIKITTRRILAGLIAIVLVGCTSQTEGTNNLSRLFAEAVQSRVDGQAVGTLPKVVVTPGMLARTTVAALQVNPEIVGGSDFLRRVARRNDSSFGTVEIWNSSFGGQIFLRNGVVVGSRGLGGDMISADADMTVRALSARAGRSALRTYTISDGDTTSTQMQFRCEIQNLGAENITIVNQVFQTSHMQEICTGGPGGDKVLKNDYWVGGATGLVHKSRQWVGPTIGYFEFILLKN